MCRKITCRLAIQVCIGYSPSGTARHRTFSIKGINPNADFSKLAAFVRDCVAPVLACPITNVTLVKKIPVFLGETPETTPAPVAEPCYARAQTVSRPASRAAFRFLLERAVRFVAGENFTRLMKRGFHKFLAYCRSYSIPLPWIKIFGTGGETQ
jgi:hypothetical protein